jgi:hypothetical protein
MSETIGNPVGRTRGAPSSAPPAAGTAAPSPPHRVAAQSVETVREAYSFACLSCAYGWEQEYEIEHHIDREGRTRVQYRANGVPVPSPLLHPTCPGCGARIVRIMGAGRVAAVNRHWERNPGAPGPHPGSVLPGAITGEPLDEFPVGHPPRLRFRLRLGRRQGEARR